MSNKKSSKNKKNSNFPFANDVKLMKDDFKNMVDEMPDDDFLDMISFLTFSFDDIDEMWAEDEGWEDEAEKFYNKGENNIYNFQIDDDSIPF